MNRPAVIYNGKLLIPAPLVTITKNYQKSGNGEIIGALYSISLAGTLVAYKGSPDSNKSFWTTSGYPPDETIAMDSRLAAVMRKQEALRELFSDDGKTLEIQSADGSQPIKCNPRVISINFEQGIWTDVCQYTVQFECDVLYPMQEDIFSDYISEASESWSLETDDSPQGLNLPRSYRVSHSISATGKRFYDDTGTLIKQPWEQARDFVLPKLGINSNFLLSSGVNNLPSYYGGYNHVRNENKDERAGSYSVQETWLLASGTSIEDFSIETSKEVASALTRVSIQGTITGLEQRDANLQIISYKYDNAVTKFNIASGLALGRAQLYSNKILNILPLTTRIGRNPVAGTITYGFEYDDRPSNLISGAISEAITLNDNLHTNVIAVIPVLGRAAGPVLQDIGTSEALSRDLSIEAVFPVPSFGTGSAADIKTAFFGNKPSVNVSGIIDALNPANNGYSQVYIQRNTESWNPKEGRYNRQISWIYEL